ncbi:MAG: hypothetical protein ACR5LA_10480 [Wolbachia sp.]
MTPFTTQITYKFNVSLFRCISTSFFCHLSFHNVIPASIMSFQCLYDVIPVLDTGI